MKTGKIVVNYAEKGEKNVSLDHIKYILGILLLRDIKKETVASKEKKTCKYSSVIPKKESYWLYIF